MIASLLYVRQCGDAPYRLERRTLAVNEDIGALAVCSKQYGILVDFDFGQAW